MNGHKAVGRNRAAVTCLAAGLVLAGSAGPQAAPAQVDVDTEVSAIGFTLRPSPRSDSAGGEAGGGAEIEAVTPGGPAADAGIVPGDVIVRIGVQPVATPKDLAAGIRADHESGRVADTLLVMRKGQVYYAVISLKAR